MSEAYEIWDNESGNCIAHGLTFRDVWEWVKDLLDLGYTFEGISVGGSDLPLALSGDDLERWVSP